MTRSGHIALAGRPNVGKSSLLNVLVGEHLALVSSKAQATRLPVTGLRTEGEVQYVFHDLPGLLDPEYAMQERMRALALEGVARADVILHLHPAPEAPAPDFTLVAGLPKSPTAPVVRVYTKGDLVSAERRSQLRQDGHVVSATTRDGIDQLLAALASMLPERPFAYPEDDIGTQPLRFFAAEYLREAAFHHLEDEVPYSFAAEIEEFRETTDPVYIRATLFVERDSQKGILIGEAGRTLKAIGTHARQRLEQLTGRRVYLDTWVRVLPKWRRDPAQLSRFGFPDLPGERP